MGYRHYFYKVKKEDVEKVKNMDYDALFEYAKEVGAETWDDEESSFYFNDDKFLDKTEVFEFGKLYWDDTADRIYSKGFPLFDKKETQAMFDDYEPFVVGKDGLLEAINIYQEKVLNYYEDLLKDKQECVAPFGIRFTKDDVKSVDKVVEHINDKIHSMRYRSIADTNENAKWRVTTSWEYEHSIFNLVHLLKVIDWETETLLFYGW